MALRNDSMKYGSVAKFLHWVIGVTIIALLIVGLLLDDMPASPDKLKLVGLHKSFGIVVLSLAVVRVIWKLKNVSPLLPFHMSGWQKFAAKAGHALLYFFMFAMPLSGWAMSSAAGYSVSVFGLFTLPNLMEPDPELRGFFRQAHGLFGWGLIAVLAVHIGAAILHHAYYKDNVLLRMLPYAKLRKDDYSRSDTMAGC